MITDRTYEDVTAAKALRARGLPFTEIEKTQLERGTVTVNTLNRIESAMASLPALWAASGYPCPAVATNTWTNAGYFRKSDFETLIANAKTLRAALIAYSTTPTEVLPLYHFAEWNKLEQIVGDLVEIGTYIKDNALKCGTFRSGARRMLPIKR